VMNHRLAVAVLMWLSAATASFVFQDGRFGSITRITRVDRRFMPPSTSCNAMNPKRNIEIELTSLRIGIAGAGAVAFGMASILSKNGHGHVTLWSPSGKGTADLIPKNDEEQKYIRSTGALHHESVPRIALDPEQLVMESDVLIVALPANGHKQVFDALALHLSSSSISPSEPTKHIIISSHASLGALYLSQLLHRFGNRHHTITSWGTTVCTARRTSGQTVDIKTIRTSVDTCCIPEDESSSSLAVCNRLFPDIDFRTREGLLAISLSNLNPQNHLAISMGNISRMDKGEEWYQFQNITPTIGGFLEGLDKERLDIATVLGLEVKTVYEHFSLSFHVPIPESGSISEMCQEINRRGNDVYGPNVADSRYITEDVPFGLTLIVALGKLVGRPAVLHESGLLICNAMYGRNFAAENDLLQAISMDNTSLKDLKEAARTGELPKNSLDLVSPSLQENPERVPRQC
jgi:opine dehydrogenase